MVRTLAWTLAAALSLTLTACGDDGSGTSEEPSSTGASDGASSSSGPASSAGTGACDGGMTCLECAACVAEQDCAEPYGMCSADLDCINYAECEIECLPLGADGEECVVSCMAQHGEGVMDGMAYVNCVELACQDVCP